MPARGSKGQGRPAAADLYTGRGIVPASKGRGILAYDQFKTARAGGEVKE